MQKYYLTVFKQIIIQETSGIYLSSVELWIIMSAIITLIMRFIVHKRQNYALIKLFHFFLTIVYVGVILFLTIFRREPGSKSGAVYTEIYLGFGLKGIYSPRVAVYSILNIALFVPWGILLYLYRVKDNIFKGIIMTTLLGFLCSFCIEFTQKMTKTGLFEMTDITTNTMGAFIGATFTALICVIIKGLKKQ